MEAKYSRRQSIFSLALLISLIALSILPGNMGIAKALTGFVKTSPANGATSQPVSMTLRWNAAPRNPYGYDQYYKICYYTGAGACDYQGLIYTTQYNLSGLARSTTYNWQVQVVYCKDSRCIQKEKHEANNGQVWSFKTVLAPINPPGAFAKIAPANNTTDLNNNVLSWTASAGATSYQYCFSPNYIDSNCAYLGGWKDIGNVTTYTIPSDTKLIWGSRYYWQIRAVNSGGSTLANDGAWWTFTTANLVGKTTLISPTGMINQSTPTYRWNHVNGVTWYYLWINHSTGNLFNQWYRTDAICSGGTCSVTPPITLNPGSHTWWVQTWNNTGYGPWSDGMAFNSPIPMVPAAATLVSPSGTIKTNAPTYTWNQVSDATGYYLWVNGPSGNVFQAQYTSAQANCNGSTCSVTPATTLVPGSHTWWVQARNGAGDGPWSAGMSFSPTPPAAASLVSPSGNIGTNAPTYTWNQVSDATWYYLWVNGPSGNIIKQWYTTAQANCNGSTCSVTPATTLPAGAHTWWIQTWNDAGYGPWSGSVDFSAP